jgi:hypothetical protein
VVFVHCSQLDKELSTAISTTHMSVRLSPGAAQQALLPALLAAAKSTTRIPNGGGYPLLVALLRMLAAAVDGCERALKMMPEDPSNLFVVDLALPASDNAGVPSAVQVCACLFLGCCLQACPEAKDAKDKDNAKTKADSIITKNSFLAMIDGKIGLNRFMETLKRPLLDSSKTQDPSLQSTLFVSPAFRTFYEAKVAAVRDGIFEFYGSGGGQECAPQQVVDMQMARIKELEAQLTGGDSDRSGDGTDGAGSVDPPLRRRRRGR